MCLRDSKPFQKKCQQENSKKSRNDNKLRSLIGACLENVAASLWPAVEGGILPPGLHARRSNGFGFTAVFGVGAL